MHLTRQIFKENAKRPMRQLLEASVTRQAGATMSYTPCLTSRMNRLTFCRWSSGPFSLLTFHARLFLPWDPARLTRMSPSITYRWISNAKWSFLVDLPRQPQRMRIHK